MSADVGQLCFRNEVLGFSTDEFLLESENLGGCWILVFNMGYLICDLRLILACRMDRRLGVSDLLKDKTRFLEGAGIIVLDLTNFTVWTLEYCSQEE